MVRYLDGFDFKGIDEATLMLGEVLTSSHLYEQGMINYIDHGRTYHVSSPLDYMAHEDKVIKIEGYERLNPVMFRECGRLAAFKGHYGHVSCHLFVSPFNAKSFDMHTDPDDVVLYMVKGKKSFEHGEGVIELNQGQSIFIPRNTPHRAINTHTSIMLSFGLELFLESKL